MTEGRARGRGPGRHRSGRRAHGPRRFLLLRARRPAGRRRRGSAPTPRPVPQRELAALDAGLTAGIRALSAQLDALRLDVAVLGGRIDAVTARLERLAAAPPSTPVVLPVPSRGPTLRLPLVRAALAEQVRDDAPIVEEQPQQLVDQRRVDAPVREPDVA